MPSNELCSDSYARWQYALSLVMCVLLIISTIMVTQFFRYRDLQRKNLPRLLYYGCVLFMLISVVLLAVFIAKTLSECYRPRTIYNHFTRAYSVLYAFQWYLLLFVLFLRFYYVFRDTRHALSRCTILVIVTMMALGILNMLSAAILWRSSLYVVLIIVLMFIALTISLLLTGLFAYKLCVVYKANASRYDVAFNQNPISEELLSLITKTSILALVSISGSILQTIVFVLVTVAFTGLADEYGDAIIDVATLCDISTNFLCIMLSLSLNQVYYQYLCGCCDRKCQSLATIHKLDKSMQDVAKHTKKSLDRVISVTDDPTAN
mmetsp:Transcript_6911/g.11417  ORF Transcript_6911/g.11417 Transcript_6911/m.11417 type:complete len:321 (-) Transcript_6911:112-1074(-)